MNGRGNRRELDTATIDRIDRAVSSATGSSSKRSGIRRTRHKKTQELENATKFGLFSGSSGNRRTAHFSWSATIFGAPAGTTDWALRLFDSRHLQGLSRGSVWPLEVHRHLCRCRGWCAPTRSRHSPGSRKAAVWSRCRGLRSDRFGRPSAALHIDGDWPSAARLSGGRSGPRIELGAPSSSVKGNRAIWAFGPLLCDTCLRQMTSIVVSIRVRESTLVGVCAVEIGTHTRTLIQTDGALAGLTTGLHPDRNGHAPLTPYRAIHGRSLSFDSEMSGL